MNQPRAYIACFSRRDPLGRVLPRDGRGPVLGTMRVFGKDEEDARSAAAFILDGHCVIDRVEIPQDDLRESTR